MDISKTCIHDHHACTYSTKEPVPVPVPVLVTEDIIMEIFFRLPPLSVFRFKFVCKSWYSLISNPYFLQKFLHYSQRFFTHSNILLISNIVILPPQEQVQEQDQQLKMFLDYALSVYIPKKFSSSYRLIDSCNGLLLYSNENPNTSTNDQTLYHVLNPITKQCFQLPFIEHFRNNYKEVHIYWIHIVFDPLVSLSFKVLICFARRNLDDYGIYIYSSETNSWRYLIKLLPCELLPNWVYLFHNCHWKSVLLNGVLYLYTYKDKLVCLDVVKDEIWFLPLPAIAIEHHKHNLLYFGKSPNGLLLRLIIKGLSYSSAFSFDIMDMEDAHENRSKIRNWTVKNRVNIEMSTYEDIHIPLAAAQIIHIYKTTGGVGKKNGEGDQEEDEVLVFLNVGSNMVISYNLTSNILGKEEKVPSFDHSHGLHVFQYTPTLFPFS